MAVNPESGTVLNAFALGSIVVTDDERMIGRWSK